MMGHESLVRRAHLHMMTGHTRVGGHETNQSSKDDKAMIDDITETIAARDADETN